MEELQNVYGEDSPSYATVKRWYNEFSNGRTSVMDDERPGRPLEIDQKISENLLTIIKSKRKITTRSLVERLNISKGSLHNLFQSIGIRKLCSRFVPRLLTGEMMDIRLQCCQQNLRLFNQVGDLLFKNLITMDETPLSLYMPESKRESTEWKLPGETSSKKMKCSATHRKCLMLSVFWDSKGVLLCDFCENGISINSEYYCNLLKEARKSKRKSRVSELYYLADNAPIHTSATSKGVVAASGFTVLSHPPYSPDLAPSDYFLFRHLKKHLRGNHFANKEDLKQATEDFFKDQPEEFFKKGLTELVVRWTKCKDAEGNYIEK